MYYLVAFLLKIFSLNRMTMSAYRKLGNFHNQYRDTQIQWYYFERTPPFIRMLERHGILRAGLRVFELGTGWVHWEALMVRCRVDSVSTVYDIWDNRSFERFHEYIRELQEPDARARLELDEGAIGLLREVLPVSSFRDAYGILGFDYVVDGSGCLAGIADGAHDLVISSDVGEHLQRADAAQIVRRTFEILKPGGSAYHQVVLTDHLCIYAKSAHPKQYLRHSRRTFLTWINNRVQYVNLLQIPEWHAMFSEAGFEIVETDRVGTCDLSAIEVHEDWADVPQDDLACTVVQFLLRKPGAVPAEQPAAAHEEAAGRGCR